MRRQERQNQCEERPNAPCEKLAQHLLANISDCPASFAWGNKDGITTFVKGVAGIDMITSHLILSNRFKHNMRLMLIIAM